jgi:hypothetical protein
VSVHSCPPGSCFAIGTWEDVFIHCDLPAGHKTLCEHVDEERGLRWLQDIYGNVSAWPGTRADHETWIASVNASFEGEAGRESNPRAR